jgi:uncharacterized protein DUF1572
MTPERTIVGAIEAEYRRYQALGDRALEQLSEPQLCQAGGEESNSIATLVWHVSGNLASRFTDFLTSDGEKPWRDRESEFQARTVSRPELQEKWRRGWTILLESLAGIGDDRLQSTVTIRGVGLSVHESLLRSLAHTAYHVGQIVFLAKALRGGDWQWLTIPPGQSAAYNANPHSEKAPGPPR